MSKIAHQGRAAFVVSILLAATTILAGCGRDQDSRTSKPKEDTLAKVKREAVLRWGADPNGGAPYVFYDAKDNKKVIGFEIDIMDKVAQKLGVKLELVPSAWDSLLEALKSGRTDLVINGIEVNPEREQRYSFSEPYFIYEQMLTIRAADKDKYKSLDDLKGKLIGTLSGAQANNVLTEAGFTEKQISPFPDPSSPYNQLDLGRVEAVLQETLIAEWYAGSNPKLLNLPKTFAPGKYAVAMRKEDASLVAEINRILDEMKKNGELAAIYRKWKLWNDRQKDIGVVEPPAAENKETK